MTAVGVLSLALASAPPAAASPDTEPAPVAATGQETVERMFELIALSAPQLDQSRLAAAIALRVPELGIRDHRHPTDNDAPFVYVGIQPGEGDVFELSVITQDGAAFERTMTAPPEDRDQIIAGEVSNLLYSILERSVAPSREDVPIPAPDPEEEAEPQPVVAQAEAAAPPPSPPSSASSSQSPPKARWRGDVGATTGAIFCVGPPVEAGPLAAWGGSIGFSAVAPVGALVDSDIRIAARRGDGSTRLLRFRFALGGGYRWRRGRLRLAVSALVSVEPWVVRRDSSPAALRLAREQVQPAPLLGGMMRFSPSYQFEVGARRRSTLSFGPRLEVAGSASPDGGVVIVAKPTADRSRSAVFRAGGLEFATMIELRGQFDL